MLLSLTAKSFPFSIITGPEATINFIILLEKARDF